MDAIYARHTSNSCDNSLEVRADVYLFCQFFEGKMIEIGQIKHFFNQKGQYFGKKPKAIWL